MTYIQTVLFNPNYEKRFAESTTNEAKNLVNIDPSCILESDGSKTVYASVLEAYARNTLRYATARKETDTVEVTRKRFTDAENAALFGLEMADSARDAELSPQKKQRFLERIAPSDAIEVRVTLTQTLQAVRAVKRDLGE